MTHTWKRLLSFGFTLFVLLSGFTNLALAADDSTQTATATISTGLKSAAEGAYSNDLTLTEFIGNLIQVLLTATGILFLVLTVWAGVIYMTAAGDDTKIKKAKGMLVSSLIGLVIIIAAYALTKYVVDALTTASTATTG
ncbi:hypothetical protein HZA87_05155 [Candidatus Uhrbacteria bacterium]|nr:hypothetical protein [Candidatus Uhrbacteria bacterium]